MIDFEIGKPVKIFYPSNARYHKREAVIVTVDPWEIRVMTEDRDILSITPETAERMLESLEEEQPMSTNVTFKQASNLIAKMANELEWNSRTDWTGDEIFNSSPTGELFHVFEYYQLAKDYFDLVEEDRRKLKGMPVPAGGKFEFTVPETWRSYKLSEDEIRAVIDLAESYKDHPEKERISHHIPIGDEIQVHTTAQLQALAAYLKGELPNDAEEETVQEEKKLDYEAVEECPNPYVGLEWTEMYSYYGKVIGKINRSISYRWQEEDPSWKKALNEPYYVIEDTVEKMPYILTADQFKTKFSYEHVGGCWVRFKFNPEEE